MGLFSYFRDRRERESAVSTSDQDSIEAAVAQAQAQAEAQGTQHGQQGEVSGLEALGMLAAMFGQAKDMEGQGVTFDSQVIDMRGTGLREEILGVIASHGIDANSSQDQKIVASEDLQRQIMEVLERNGLDFDASQFPTGMPMQSAEPADPIDPTVPQIRNPLDR